MKRVATIIAGLIALAAVAGTASAALRSPQVPVAGGTLQGYLNSVGESINVLTDQQAIFEWASTVSSNSTFTIQVELSGNAGANTIGLYNASAVAPPLYLVFPGVATNGWFAVASFRTSPTRVVVNLFDNNANLVGNVTYLGADRNDFGFYLQGPGGLFFTQDPRNPGGDPQALTYAGTGQNSGSWWLCWEDAPFVPGQSDFDDAVLFLESVNPTPVNHASWGSLKARFR
ncbi:MAG TPA: hypothetical protein VI504_02185 [Candidatus Eisenbacteria bacterium]|jgi:hypothetical protein